MLSKNHTTLLLVSALLVACGSSSSTGKAPTGSTTGSSTTAGTGGGTSTGGSTGTGGSAPSTTNDINKIIFLGKEITLIPYGISAGGFFSLDTADILKVVSGTKYAYSRFGFIYDKKSTKPKSARVFYRGYKTDNTKMPITGTAVTYTGDAVLAALDEVKGTATFTADFVNKTLKGTLADFSTTPATDDIAIDAVITGNAFKQTGGDTAVEGYFYGDQAAELGGTVEKEMTISGKTAPVKASFGAKKQ